MEPWYHPNTVKRLSSAELSAEYCRIKDELELLEDRCDPRAVEQRKQLQAQLELLATTIDRQSK